MPSRCPSPLQHPEANNPPTSPSSSSELAITPLSPTAPAPSCTCTSAWEHNFFTCKSPSFLPHNLNPSLENEREKAWSEILRGQTFCLASLKKAEETRDVYHALRQEKHVLLRFLVHWHEDVRMAWKGLFDDEKRAQEDVILRGMEVCNKIVMLLLRRENERRVYGTEMLMDEEKRSVLGKLVFDLGDLEMGEQGVEGRPRLGYCDPEGCACEDKDGDGRDFGVLAGVLGGKETGMETELKEMTIGEREEEHMEQEKNRHDSGVAMEEDREVALEEAQNEGRSGDEKEEGSDDEDGGVPLGNERNADESEKGVGRPEDEAYIIDEDVDSQKEEHDTAQEKVENQQEKIEVANKNTGEDDAEPEIGKQNEAIITCKENIRKEREEVNTGEENIGKRKDEADISDEIIDNESDEEYITDAELEEEIFNVSDEDFGLYLERQFLAR